MRHIISILVENQFGVLARVSGLFSARGYNIDSLCVAETEDPAVSRMTVVVRGDDRVLAQIEKQLKKLVETIDVEDLTGIAHVERELVMVRVKAKGKKRSEVIEIANIFRAGVDSSLTRPDRFPILGVMLLRSSIDLSQFGIERRAARSTASIQRPPQRARMQVGQPTMRGKNGNQPAQGLQVPAGKTATMRSRLSRSWSNFRFG